MTEADFAAYRVEDTDPLRCSYRNVVVVSAPPPSSGGVTMCEILNVLEGYDMTSLGFHSAQSGASDDGGDAPRLSRPATPSWVTRRSCTTRWIACCPRPMPLTSARASLTAPRPRRIYSPARPRTKNRKRRSIPWSTKDGNAVSVTYTINGSFGAVVIAGDTGFLSERRNG